MGRRSKRRSTTETGTPRVKRRRRGNSHTTTGRLKRVVKIPRLTRPAATASVAPIRRRTRRSKRSGAQVRLHKRFQLGILETTRHAGRRGGKRRDRRPAERRVHQGASAAE